MVNWPQDRKMFEIGDAVLDNKEIKKILEWKPKTSLEVGLEKTKNYFINRIEKYLK